MKSLVLVTMLFSQAIFAQELICVRYGVQVEDNQVEKAKEIIGSECSVSHVTNIGDSRVVLFTCSDAGKYEATSFALNHEIEAESFCDASMKNTNK